MSHGNMRPFLPQGNDVVSAYLNNLSKEVNTHNLIGGNGIHISQGIHGKTIHVLHPDGADPMVFVGQFDFNKSYFPNQVVVVPANGYYVDEDGEAIPFSDNLTSSYDGASMCAGTFVCKNFIPGSGSISDDFITFVVPAYGSQTPTDATANAYRWYDDVLAYYPTTKSVVTIPSNTNTTSDSGFNINTGIQYWQQLGSSATATPPPVIMPYWQGIYNPLLAGTYPAYSMVYVADGSINGGTYIRTTAMPISGAVPDPTYPPPSATGGIDYWFPIVGAFRQASTCGGNYVYNGDLPH